MRVSMRAWSPRGISRRMSSTCGWSRRPGSPGLGGAGARPPAGLIWSPAVLGLAVGLGDPRSYCWGVAACWLDAEFCRPRAYGAGLGFCGVAVGAGCDPSCACPACVLLVSARPSRGTRGGSCPLSSPCCPMIVSSRFLRRGWTHPGPKPPKTATPYATASDGRQIIESQRCLPLTEPVNFSVYGG